MDNGLIKHRIKERMVSEGVPRVSIPVAAIPAPFTNQALVNITGMSSMVGLTVFGCTTDLVTLGVSSAIAFIAVAASLMGYNTARERGNRTIFISHEDDEVWTLNLEDSNTFEKAVTILNVRTAIHSSKVRTSILIKWLGIIFPVVIEPEPALIAAKEEVDGLWDRVLKRSQDMYDEIDRITIENETLGKTTLRKSFDQIIEPFTHDIHKDMSAIAEAEEVSKHL